MTGTPSPASSERAALLSAPVAKETPEGLRALERWRSIAGSSPEGTETPEFWSQVCYELLLDAEEADR